MKKLRARMIIVWSAFLTIMWVVLPVLAWASGPPYSASRREHFVLFLWYCILPILIVPFCKSYRRHCISYGKGIIILKRERKRLENGRPAGKWEVREDEIALQDIEWYGPLLLGEGVEFLSDGYTSIKQQFCICLNSGEKFAFVTAHYSKGQIQELCRYIEEHTGMAPIKRRVKYSTKDKILIIGFLLILYTIIGVCWYVFDFAGKDRQETKLSMEKIIELSQKGHTLTWGDFKQYKHTDVGSGLYIAKYEIEGESDYYLLVGGPTMQKDVEPWYIYLYKDKDDRQAGQPEKSVKIDIRKEDVEMFLIEQSANDDH